MSGDGFDECTFCRRQALHVEEMAERVRQLEAELYGRAWEPPAEFRLTACETALVQAFVAANGRALTPGFLIEASRTPASHKDFPDPKMIDTVLCILRKKLEPFGVNIETIKGRGRRIDPETRARLLNWPARTISAAA